MKQELLSIEKDLDKKFLKMYTAHYKTDGKDRDYFFVSRHDEKDLALNNDDVIPTAIEAFTYYQKKKGFLFWKKTHTYVVMIEEFRSAIGKYVLSFPAGLIEKDEEVYNAIIREVYEEVGGEVSDIKLLQKYPLTMCAGMTDESNYMATVKLESFGKQHLEETEDINVKVYEINDLKKKISNNELYLTASGYLGYLSILNEINRK